MSRSLFTTSMVGAAVLVVALSRIVALFVVLLHKHSTLLNSALVQDLSKWITVDHFLVV
jgi:hypothetical protein